MGYAPRRFAWHADATTARYRIRSWISCLPDIIHRALYSKDGLVDQLKKRLAERALNAEFDHHLEQEDEAGREWPRRQLPRQPKKRWLIWRGTVALPPF